MFYFFCVCFYISADSKIRGLNAVQSHIKLLAGYKVQIQSSYRALLSCQPRVTVMSCFVYKVIRDLETIDHLCINPFP